MKEPQLPPQRDILLVTLNSTYQHCSFGLRYLYANMGSLTAQTQILEYTIKQSPKWIVEQILQHQPKIVGFGVYIWNGQETLECISILKRVSPETQVVIGGPEVSYESDHQKIVQLADYLIQGEADFKFRELCENLMNPLAARPPRIIAPELPEVRRIQLPYHLYSDEDIANRVIYVEASRGCPYKCEYCLSSLDKSVRSFDLDPFLNEMQTLIERGARQFKFVDRTFNLSINSSLQILEFFLKFIDRGLFLHFEMVPDRLPDELKQTLLKFPAGSLQFEVGIQTWNPEVAKNVSRRNDFTKVRANFEFLKKAHVHTHADLIVGLPGETLESFAQGFDELARLEPDEIQVGILKRLKGTPIIRHDLAFKMVYQEDPPFQILSNKDMDFMTMQKMSRFAKFWDLYANSGNFPHLLAYFKESAQDQSLFWKLFDFTEYLGQRHPEGFGISLQSQAESAYLYLTERLHLTENTAREVILKDYSLGAKKRDIPNFLRTNTASSSVMTRTLLNERQIRHLESTKGTTRVTTSHSTNDVKINPS